MAFFRNCIIFIMKDTKQEAQNAVKQNDHEHSVEGKATQINELVMAQVKQTCECVWYVSLNVFKNI